MSADRRDHFDIAVIGLGYIGLPTAAFFASTGLQVYGFDINADRVTTIAKGEVPFVEPGFEIDMGCLVCGGKGCSVCKHVGWIEVMPGGTPHPNVLKAAGLDPNEYTGFYVNIGLDRLVMMRYGVDDVRLFHSADLRFLEQFR